MPVFYFSLLFFLISRTTKEISIYVRGLQIMGSDTSLKTINKPCSNCIWKTFYHNNPKYSDRQVWAKSVDPDQMLQNAASDPGLHCLPLIQYFLDTSTGNKMDLFRF